MLQRRLLSAAATTSYFSPAAGDDERVGADSQSVPDRGSLAGISFRAERTATGTGSPSTADGRNAIRTLLTSNNPTRHVARVNARPCRGRKPPHTLSSIGRTTGGQGMSK
jgi:hypothetical protein